MYFQKFQDNDWAEFSKNKTKRNGGRVASTGCPRRRAAQVLPRHSKKDASGLLITIPKSKTLVKENLDDNTDTPILDSTALFMDETSMNTRRIHYALDAFVKGSFGSTSKAKGWSYDRFQLIPPAQTGNDPDIWEALLDECHCMGLLTSLGLYRCLHFCLHKFFYTLRDITRRSEPTLLLYFWKICSSILDIRFRGRVIVQGDDPIRGESFALMRIILRYMKQLFSLHLGIGHPVVHLVETLTHVIKSSPAQFKYILGLAYSMAIDRLGEMIGPSHAQVSMMSSHFAKQNWIPGTKMHEQMTHMKYQSSLLEAERTSGHHAKSRILLLYNYTYAMTKGYGDNDLVFRLAAQLRALTMPLCCDSVNLKCSIAVRAFVFSTGLLAKNYHWQDPKLARGQLYETIRILWRGDLECLIYALSLSRLLEAKLRGSETVKAMAEQIRRTENLRSKICRITLSNPIEAAKRQDGDSNSHVKNYLEVGRSLRKRDYGEFNSSLTRMVGDTT